VNEFDKVFYSIVGRKLRELRNDKGLTLKEVAENLGITFKTLQRYELGERKIDIPLLQNIVTSLGGNYDSFINDIQKEQYSDIVKEESHYYINDETLKIAEELYKNPQLKILFDASRNSKPEDLLLVAELVKKMNDTDK
jgi:transcriptional regulator with XRE-family HTH domain